MSIVGRINKLAEVLNDRGFDKESSEMLEIKEASLTGTPFFEKTKRTQRMFEPSTRSYHVPSDPKTPAYKKGEFIINLDPTTGKEELMMWDGKRMVPKSDLDKMIETGLLGEDRLLGSYRESPLEVQNEMRPLLEYAKSKRPFVNLPAGEIGLPYYPKEKLAQIRTKLDKIGYTLLVKKLDLALSEYEKSTS